MAGGRQRYGDFVAGDHAFQSSAGSVKLSGKISYRIISYIRLTGKPSSPLCTGLSHCRINDLIQHATWLSRQEDGLIAVITNVNFLAHANWSP